VSVTISNSASESHTFFAAPNQVTVKLAPATVTASLTPGVPTKVWAGVFWTTPVGANPGAGGCYYGSGFDDRYTFTYTITVNGVSGTVRQPVRIRWVCNYQGQMDFEEAGPVTLDLGASGVLEIRNPLRLTNFPACADPELRCSPTGSALQLELLLPTAGTPANAAPTADAGADRSVALTAATASVTLDGTGSADPEHDALTYTWTGDFAGGTATGATPTVQFSTVGAHAVTLTVSDGAHTATDQATVTVTDGTPPVVAYALTPAQPNGANGWSTADVALAWTVSEPETPGSLARTGCADQTITADQAKTSYPCAATSDGGATAAVTVVVGRDATKPTIQGSVAAGTPDGLDGWYLSAPVVRWSCSDATSGIASCSAPTTLGESAGAQQVTGTATDAAGNAATATVGGLRVDLTDPTLVCGVAPTFLVGEPGSVIAVVQDQASGPAQATVSAAASTATTGQFTVAVTGRDNAGRSRTVQCPYGVEYDLGQFTAPVPPGNTGGFVAGQILPLRWQLTGYNGAPVTTLASVRVTVRDAGCALGSTPDQPEEQGAGSGLHNLGGGRYMFNWQTPRSYAGSCKVVSLDLGDGTPHTFQVDFRR
jgi:PKD repeat protein